ncbi:arginase family protein [Butyrivibrio sp. NC3005]|uniref:arginase family protein n=1 Tax=Butyrivibrio sp. NC3005 TaxID=1280685 RepID=UPI00041764F5|nr:arginase family protein [Butyrivibrio sp. NC3005]
MKNKLNNVVVFNFSKIYEDEDFLDDVKNPRFIDVSDISGTRGICDDIAISEIKKRISVIQDETNENISNGVHFIDNGNYHYMTKILTDYIDEPFQLVYFDHHPDLKASIFGDILSCGSWVRNAQIENPNIRKISAIGIDSSLWKKIPIEDREHIAYIKDFDTDTLSKDAQKYITRIVETLDTELPIYISIDKDVLDKKEIQTNWDQGTMTLNRMLMIIKHLKENFRVIGVDICGEMEQRDSFDALETEQKRNIEANKKILQIFFEKDVDIS